MQGGRGLPGRVQCLDAVQSFRRPPHPPTGPVLCPEMPGGCGDKGSTMGQVCFTAIPSNSACHTAVFIRAVLRTNRGGNCQPPVHSNLCSAPVGE